MFGQSAEAWKSVIFVVSDNLVRYNLATRFFYTEAELHALIYDQLCTILQNKRAEIEKLRAHFAVITRPRLSSPRMSQVQQEEYAAKLLEAIIQNITFKGESNYSKSNVIIANLMFETSSTRSATRERIFSVINKSKVDEVASPAFITNFNAVSLFDGNVSSIEVKLRVVCNASVRYINRWLSLKKDVADCNKRVSQQLEDSKARVKENIDALKESIAKHKANILLFSSDHPVRLSPIRVTNMVMRGYFFGKIFTNPLRTSSRTLCRTCTWSTRYVVT